MAGETTKQAVQATRPQLLFLSKARNAGITVNPVPFTIWNSQTGRDEKVKPGQFKSQAIKFRPISEAVNEGIVTPFAGSAQSYYVLDVDRLIANAPAGMDDGEKRKWAATQYDIIKEGIAKAEITRNGDIYLEQARRERTIADENARERKIAIRTLAMYRGEDIAITTRQVMSKMWLKSEIDAETHRLQAREEALEEAGT